MKLGIDPAVRIPGTIRATATHLGIDPVEVGNEQLRDGVEVDRRGCGDAACTVLGRDRLTFEVHHDLVVSGRPDDHLQQVVRVVVRPHGQRSRRLAGGIVALSDAERLAQHRDQPAEQSSFRLRRWAEQIDESLSHPGIELQLHLTPQ